MRPARYTEAETRALILKAADELINKYGFRKTTIADIAKACGFSPANVHKFFGNKAAIKRAIAAQLMEDMYDGAARAIDTTEGAEQKLRTMIKTVHEITLFHFNQKTNAMEGFALAAEEKWPEIQNYRMKLLAKLKDILRTGHESGEFKITDIERTANGIHMALFRLFHPQMVIENIDEPDSGDAEILTEVLLSAVK